MLNFDIPISYLNLLIVLGVSLVIGLSQRKHKMESDEQEYSFGADRTYILIGLLSYILYLFDPNSKVFWGVGGVLITFLLYINYYFKLLNLKNYGITSIITALITYCFPLLIVTQPLPFSLAILVVILLVTEMKSMFISLAHKMNADEFITLAKFLIIAGIILPMLPNQSLVDFVEITPRNIWLSTVIISGVSYFSYLLRKFVFPKSGLLLSTIFGGMYSSTVTTIILSRQTKNTSEGQKNKYVGAIILASSMMYLRCGVLLLIFNPLILQEKWIYFAILILSTFLFGLWTYRTNISSIEHLEEKFPESNPLELKVALIFAALFTGFMMLTHLTLQYFGDKGLDLLALVVGITDITPFLTALYQNSYSISSDSIIMATFIATFSSQVTKTIYSLCVVNKLYRRTLIKSFLVTILLNLFIILFLYLVL